MKARSNVLKDANIKWLVMLAIMDIAAVLLFIAPEVVDASMMARLRASVAPLMPVVILLLTGLLSHEAKARLVYWRIANPLPGSQAFTKYGPADARIDMKALAKNVGALPTDPGEQNARWYKLYRLVGDDPAVSHAHKLYLMYRDMAAMSFLLIPLVPAALWYTGVPPANRWIAGGLFAVQYVVCAISARHSGTRFVCNVLAVHSTKEVREGGAT
ncbi:hypothetical protein [Pandoraea sp. NPDC087047]|uniref:hypothetical protein n=1 Tax=Pandoraea sp. NPDC087047 TaxID=3364390 RepID=UPI0038159B52